MSDTRWAKIVSWHAMKTEARTRCGRYASPHERSDTLPEGKSCETCLRIVAREGDR